MNNNHTYFKQLNGIRALAVFMVLLDHWILPDILFPLGHLGVVIFFVLSGFLITRNLLLDSQDIQNKDSSFGIKLKKFLLRRTLRIFPIFFLVIFISLFLNIPPLKENWPWFIFYVPNWLIIYQGHWLGVLDHIWSLAVEEQYYLFFPYFILLTNKSFHKWILIGMVIISYIFRIVYFFNLSAEELESQWFIAYVNTINCIDGFGIGGLLAYLYIRKNSLLLKSKIPYFGMPLILILFLFNFLIGRQNPLVHASFNYVILERTLSVYIGFFLIWIAIQENFKPFKWIFENKIIAYFGLISYGVYLYHTFVFGKYHNDFTIWNLIGNPQLGTIGNFIIQLLIIFIISSFSYEFFEKKLLKLKDKLN